MHSATDSHVVQPTCGNTVCSTVLVERGQWHWTKLTDKPLPLIAGENEIQIRYKSKYGNELKMDLLSFCPEGIKPFLPENAAE